MSRGFVKDNGLGLFFLAIFLAALVGQAVAGHDLHVNEAVEHHEEPVSFWAYVSSSEFGRSVMENGIRRSIFENSLLIVMLLLFLGSWFAHSVTGWSAFNSEEIAHDGDSVSYWSYIGSADFWETTLQNWQSEFLAVGSMAVFAIYLRQRGSPESKPVGAPHTESAVEG